MAAQNMDLQGKGGKKLAKNNGAYEHLNYEPMNTPKIILLF